MRPRVLAAAAALVLVPAAAQAGEVRFGGGPSGHDLVFQVDDEGQEQGASITADVVFDSPPLLRRIGARPYVGGALSLDGHTNFADAGVLWRLEGRKFYGEFATGLAVHDGEVDLPRPDPSQTPEENARRQKVLNEKIDFGSRVVLHFGAAVGYRVTDRWAVELGTQHWSHGGLFGDNNDGADILNLRAAYRFGG